MRIENGLIKVSISEINSFVTCRRHHYKVYLEGKKSASPELSFGSAMHKVCEDLLIAKMSNPAQKPTDAPEMFESFYEQMITDEGLVDSEWKGMIETGMILAKKWGEQIFPRMRPKRIEFQVERQLYDGPYAFYGNVDYEDERGFLIDWKTSKNKPKKDNRDPRWEYVVDQHYKMQGLNYMFASGVSRFNSVFLVKESMEVMEPIKFPYSPYDLKDIKPFVDAATESVIHEIYKTYQRGDIIKDIENFKNSLKDLPEGKASELLDEYKRAAYKSWNVEIFDGAFKMSPYHYSQCQMCFNKEGCVIL